MATTRLMPLHIGKGQTARDAIKRALGYVKDPMKTENGIVVTSYGCTPQTAEAEFMLMRREYLTITGRRRGKDDVLAYHLRQSYKPREITPEEANRLGQELARRFTKGNNAFIVCTHIDKAYIRNHIIWNAVNLDCDRKLRNFWGSTRAVGRLNDTICIENGYSIVENPKPHGKSYGKWLGDQAKPSHRELLRLCFDNALSQKPADWDALLKLVQEAGYEIKPGHNPSFRCEGWGRPVRLDTLGENDSRGVPLSVLKGEKRVAWGEDEQQSE